ncbi:MAG TPA: pteridine reductase [Burkholderiales bacterium]
MQALAGKAILITGAARRVGAAIARRLHALGANVLIHYRDSSADADVLVAQLNGERRDSAHALGLELSDTDAIPAFVARAAAVWGRLDGLVNNASGFYATPLGEITPQQWSDLMSSNLKAPLFLAQAAAPELRKSGGCIVNIVDIHAERPLKDYVVYSVAKAGLAGLTRSLALELAPQVRVNGIAPGAIEWPEHGQMEGVERERILAATPLGRVGGAEEIARAAGFLFADAPYVTGQILAVDGGRSIYL